MALTRDDLVVLDKQDPLANQYDQFTLPDGVIYLDGNSLGALPKATMQRVADVITREWGHDLIRSWNSAGWVDLPFKIGDKIGKLIGAEAGEVVVTDSTSINVFKALSAILMMMRTKHPLRRLIISERDNFPTDLYMAQGLISLLNDGYELKLVGSDEIDSSIATESDRIALVMLTHVNYRTGAMHDMVKITRAVHDCGGMILWDLAHSAGAVLVDLDGAEADFAIGCGYKYLNGGPGAPAFIYVAKRHHATAIQPLSGWFGHAHPFTFEPHYVPAEGIQRFLCGTPPVISMAALDIGVETLLHVDFALLREKGKRMTDLFISLVEERCSGFGLKLVTPRSADERGNQVCFQHPHGYPIMRALITSQVIGDFRAPDILRFGFAPIYLRYADVWDAAEQLKSILEGRKWDRAEFKQMAAVT